MEIIGVDFSGAKSDRNTWLARGALDPGGTLALEHCGPAPRSDLAGLLACLPGPAVAALDFPFSVPEAFAGYWRPEATAMPDLWAAAASMEFAEFMALRDRFVALYGEPKRVADRRFPESFSCLHKTNPNLVPMTFRGMQMLDRLKDAGCEAPPLPPPDSPRVVLLESMPGAVLRSLGLPFKGYKNGTRAMRLREEILDGLSRRATVAIGNLEDFRELCLGSHDCLDAVVAAVAAALWARDPALFWRPPSRESEEFDPVALLEGWLYAPVFLHARSG